MARTKEEIAAYNHDYRQRHIDHIRATNRTWYAENRAAEIEKARERSAARKDRLGEDYTEARRIERNMRIARRAGCTDDEAWEVAMQAEYERNTNGETALRGGRFHALIAEHLAMRDTFAKLDARQWAGVPDFAPVVDEGYELEDDQEVA